MTKEKRIWVYRYLAIAILSVLLIFAVVQGIRHFFSSRISGQEQTHTEVGFTHEPTYREMNFDDYAMDPSYAPAVVFPDTEEGRVANPEYASKFSFWLFAKAGDESVFLFNYHSGLIERIENYLSHQESFDGARMVWMTSDTGTTPGSLYFGEYSGYREKIADGVVDYRLSPDGSLVYYTTQREGDPQSLQLKAYNLSNSATQLVRDDLPAVSLGDAVDGGGILRHYAVAFDGRVVTSDSKEMEVLHHQNVEAEDYKDLSLLGNYGSFVLFPIYAETESGSGLLYYQFDDGGRTGYAVSHDNAAVHLGSFSSDEDYKILFNKTGTEALVISQGGTFLYKGAQRIQIYATWAEPLLNHRAASYKLSDHISVYGVNHYAHVLFAIPREDDRMLYNLATFDSEKLNVFSLSTRMPLLSADGSKFTTNHPYTALANFVPSDESESNEGIKFGIRTQTVYSVSSDGQISYVTPTEGYLFDWNAMGVDAMDAISFATNASGNIQIAIVPGADSAFAQPTVYVTNFSQGAHLAGIQNIQPVQVTDVFFGDRLFYIARDEQSGLTLAMVGISEQQAENENLLAEYVGGIQGYHWYGQSASCIDAEGNLVFMGKKIIQTDIQVNGFMD